MKDIERARFDLDILRPYVAFLERKVEPLGDPSKPELCYPGEPLDQHATIFTAPLTDQQKIDKIGIELKLIADSAKFSGDGHEL
jgi:hypothetical protein